MNSFSVGALRKLVCIFSSCRQHELRHHSYSMLLLRSISFSIAFLELRFVRSKPLGSKGWCFLRDVSSQFLFAHLLTDFNISFCKINLDVSAVGQNQAHLPANSSVPGSRHLPHGPDNSAHWTDQDGQQRGTGDGQVLQLLPRVGDSAHIHILLHRTVRAHSHGCDYQQWIQNTSKNHPRKIDA